MDAVQIDAVIAALVQADAVKQAATMQAAGAKEAALIAAEATRDAAKEQAAAVVAAARFALFGGLAVLGAGALSLLSGHLQSYASRKTMSAKTRVLRTKIRNALQAFLNDDFLSEVWRATEIAADYAAFQRQTDLRPYCTPLPPNLPKDLNEDLGLLKTQELLTLNSLHLEYASYKDWCESFENAKRGDKEVDYDAKPNSVRMEDGEIKQEWPTISVSEMYKRRTLSLLRSVVAVQRAFAPLISLEYWAAVSNHNKVRQTIEELTERIMREQPPTQRSGSAHAALPND